VRRGRDASKRTGLSGENEKNTGGKGATTDVAVSIRKTKQLTRKREPADQWEFEKKTVDRRMYHY